MTDSEAKNSTVIAVSPENFASKRWLPFESFSFAASEIVSPIVLNELANAVVAFPIGFIKQEESFIPVALLGINIGENLFVSSDGNWLGRYIPAFFRAYPFQLVEAENGEFVLCFDEASNLLSEEEGEMFFNEEGEASDSVKAMLEFLGQLTNARQKTLEACKELEALELLEPWGINIDNKSASDGESKSLEGLFKINEKKFLNLSNEELKKLQNHGALNLLYAQLFSSQNLNLLGELANQKLTSPSLGVDFKLEEHDSGTLDFGSLK